MLTIVQRIKQKRKYFKEIKKTIIIVIDYKNREYFKSTKITNRRQIR